jgi:uncharacterized protein YkwD
MREGGVATVIELPSAPILPATRGAHYMPAVYAATPVVGQGEGVAWQVFEMMRDHPEQGRNPMVWDELLARAANDRVYLQAVEGWTGHLSPDGIGPNFWVETYGYELPEWYSGYADANNIESLAHNGDGTAEGIFNAWLDSFEHRGHILGLDPFYAAQTHVGVGYYGDPNSEKKHYWCVLSAPPPEE